MNPGRWGLVILLIVTNCATAQTKQTGKSQPNLRMAVTFDDLPVSGPLPPGQSRVGIAEQIIRALKAEHVPPTYGFVNAVHAQYDPGTVDVLGTWRASGNLLGNHTWSHVSLNRVSLQDFEGDLLRDEPILDLLMAGQDWRWLRYPYLAEGDTMQKRLGIRVFLAQHGYKIASVTMNFDDYDWNGPYARCIAKHDAQSVNWLEASYLQAADENIGYYRAMSKQLYQRDIRYVLLLHVGAFDAHMLPQLLRLYRERDFSFVPLEQAEQDPFYRYDMNPKLLPGPDLLEQAMRDKHLPLPQKADYFKQLQAICR
ncbi:MAG TPA: polysaccharide deacetylase family protein [Acidobacteriaceae bacterium]|nr:polysaccharide deacetylase family protein [Acidobacteriaceae bacterium]